MCSDICESVFKAPYGISRSSAQLHTRRIITSDRLIDCAVKKEETMDEMEVVFLSDFWYAFILGCLALTMLFAPPP